MDYTKLNKALRICAGPGCGDECPYYGETKGGKTCRAWLLSDAEIALAANKAENDALREECEKLAADRDRQAKECEELKDYALALEKEGQEARAMRDKMAADNVELRKECEMTVMRCQTLQGEINALVLKLGKKDDKTDRPSVSDDLAEQVGKLVAHANYQQGRADTLAEIVARCSFGGGGRHD